MKQIVHIRGIVASGKSVALRRVMRRLGGFSKTVCAPEEYIRPAPNPVYVLGYYSDKTDAGGVDRFALRKGGADYIVNAVETRLDQGYTVFMEHFRFDQSCEWARKWMDDGIYVNTIILDTPPEIAYKDWNSRGRSPLHHTLKDSKAHYECLQRTKDRLVEYKLPFTVCTRKSIVDTALFQLTTPVMLQ